MPNTPSGDRSCTWHPGSLLASPFSGRSSVIHAPKAPLSRWLQRSAAVIDRTAGRLRTLPTLAEAPQAGRSRSSARQSCEYSGAALKRLGQGTESAISSAATSRFRLTTRVGRPRKWIPHSLTSTSSATVVRTSRLLAARRTGRCSRAVRKPGREWPTLDGHQPRGDRNSTVGPTHRRAGSDLVGGRQCVSGRAAQPPVAI